MPTPDLNLLLVEDSFAVARELQTLLTAIEKGTRVQHVETLGQALSLVARERFDCVLVDLQLPDAEGLRAVDRLRARDPDTAIIVLSGEDDGELAAEALRRGAQGYLLKLWLRRPELPAELRRLIQHGIERRQQDLSGVEPVPEDVGSASFPRTDDDLYALAFQPWAELEGGAICGIEVLLASSAVQGKPRDILRAAESQGELAALSHWVLRRVGSLWLKWRSKGLAPSRLSVNLAPSELHARHFARSRLALTEELGLATTDLQIELAEDQLLGADVKSLAELQDLRAAGIRIVADNVGRSQAALLALGRLPLDGIKLDTSLIEAVRHQDRAARATMRGLVSMSAELGISCCAVGVEVGSDYTVCREFGVQHLQGYWVARPQNAAATEGWLARCMPTGQQALRFDNQVQR